MYQLNNEKVVSGHVDQLRTDEVRNQFLKQLDKILIQA